ncbi:MAG TPA: hypothetical protein VHE99_09870 [Gammaproteobacteria bacterium]|nr:hypothetical protein [Gammaproteobacteria bacterium]
MSEEVVSEHTDQLKVLQLFYNTLSNPEKIDDAVKDSEQIQFRTQEHRGRDLKPSSYSFAQKNGFFKEFSRKGGLSVYEAAFDGYQSAGTQINALDEVMDERVIKQFQEICDNLAKTVADLEIIEVEKLTFEPVTETQDLDSEIIETSKLTFEPDIRRIAGICKRCGVDKRNDFASLVIVNAVVADIGKQMLKELPAFPEAPIPPPKNISETHPDFLEFIKQDQSYRVKANQYTQLKQRIEEDTELFVKQVIEEFNEKNAPQPGIIFLFDSTVEGLNFRLSPQLSRVVQNKLRELNGLESYVEPTELQSLSLNEVGEKKSINQDMHHQIVNADRRVKGESIDFSLSPLKASAEGAIIKPSIDNPVRRKLSFEFTSTDTENIKSASHGENEEKIKPKGSQAVRLEELGAFSTNSKNKKRKKEKKSKETLEAEYLLGLSHVADTRAEGNSTCLIS